MSESNTENEENDYNARDPGQDVIEKNIRTRLQRVANQTKEELDKVLKRVDSVCNLIALLF